jgi:hypothetical protein
MSDNQRQQIYNTLNQEDTETLVAHWQRNNHVDWTDQAFEVMAEILRGRLVELPTQDKPVYDATEEEIEEQEEEDSEDVEDESEEEENEGSGPVFYEPQEVLSLVEWLDRAAGVGAVIAALMSAFTMPSLETMLTSFFPNIALGPVVITLVSVVISLVAAALQGALVYFPLKGLAYLLKILMEMEFNSRGEK